MAAHSHETPSASGETGENQRLHIGWAETDITPEKTVQVAGQLHVRLSEGIADPVTATALALSSGGPEAADGAILVSCDLIAISDGLLTSVRQRVDEKVPDLDCDQVYLNATHNHTGPEIRGNADYRKYGGGPTLTGIEIELPGIEPREYVEFAAQRIADAVAEAWRERRPGSIAYGQGQAVVGHVHRPTRHHSCGDAEVPGSPADGRCVVGSEDHAVRLMAAWSAEGELTGLVVNVACPARVDEEGFEISADYWHETRRELRRRLGQGLFLLPQCSSAAELTPRPQVGGTSEERMRRLSGRTQREEIAVRIADAVSSALSCPSSTVVRGFENGGPC